MENKFCIYCGTQLEKNALFCVGCGNKTDEAQAPAQSAPAQSAPAAEPSYAYAATPPEPAPQQTGAYQQPPVPQQPGAYYQQPPAGPGYPPQPPAGGYPYAGYSGAANTGYNPPKKGSKGLLIGIIIGLVVLAAAVVIAVLLLRKPPVSKPGDIGAGSSTPAGTSSQGDNTKPSAAPSDLKKDATLNEIAGIWEGEIEFTRMDGFENLPAEELPPDFEEIIKEVLENPAPLEFEIEEDGNWDFNADVVMGMWFSSDDYDYDKYDSSPLVINGLKNGTFDVSYEEKIDEDDIQGNASMRLTGTVCENSDGLYIVGTISISMKADGATIIEEGNYRVTLTEPADSYETDDWDAYEDEDWEDEDADMSNSANPDGPSLSTSIRPEIDDFDWYWDDVFYSGAPYDAAYVYDFNDLKGSWKAFFYYDPFEEVEAYGYELLNIVVSGNETDVSLTLDPYEYYDGINSEYYDTSSDEDYTLYGSYDQGTVGVGEPGFMVYVTEVYYLNGVQYALGYIEFQSGEPSYVALMRP